MNKYVKVNHYNNPFPKYLPVNEKSNGNFIKTVFMAVVGFVCVWLFLWALSYTACVAKYKSSVCKQNVTTQIIIKILNHGSKQ